MEISEVRYGRFCIQNAYRSWSLHAHVLLIEHCLGAVGKYVVQKPQHRLSGAHQEQQI